MSNAEVYIHVFKFLGVYVFISHEFIWKSGITGSYGNTMFNTLRNCWRILKCCIVSHSHKKYGKISNSLLNNTWYCLSYHGHFNLHPPCIFYSHLLASVLSIKLLRFYLSYMHISWSCNFSNTMGCISLPFVHLASMTLQYISSSFLLSAFFPGLPFSFPI